MTDEKVVMYDSDEAATRVDIPGWKSRLGHFYPGDNSNSEHGARWAQLKEELAKEKKI